MEKETTSNNKLTPSYPTIYFHRMNLLTPQLFSANSPGPSPHAHLLEVISPAMDTFLLWLQVLLESPSHGVHTVYQAGSDLGLCYTTSYF